MLLPINWLKHYVEVTETAEQVADRFIELGFECEVIKNETLDLEITPNRGDVLSIIGLAREYAASTGQTVKMPQSKNLMSTDKLEDFDLKVEPAAYHRLAASLIRGVKNQPSPAWLKEAVESVGMNSIDMIVDLTNYVMFELGIPMHAFDRDKLPAQSFHVRLSSKGEHFTSLKNESVELPEQAIIVESGGEVIDLLGIRGGQSSMITPTTQNILVWSASVPRPLIRQAVKQTGIRTEAAYRHERETDWDMVPVALARFVTLLQEITGQTDAISMVTMAATQRTEKRIAYSTEATNQLLGTNYSEEQIERSLKRLGFTLANHQAIVPSWRYFDINLPEDLIEEVARMQGYTKLPHQVIAPTEKRLETHYARLENLKDQLVAAGLTEVYTESFAGREETKLAGWSETNLAILANPVNRDFAYCRPTMIPNLVKLLTLNSWSDDARIFEVGTVFPAQEKENIKIALAAYGKQQKLFEQWVPAEAITHIGPDDPLAKLHKLRRPITVAEIELNQVKINPDPTYSQPSGKINYQSVSIYPPSIRDISLIIDSTVNPLEIAQKIRDISPEHILLVELFDQFISEKFGPHKQSLAFHVIYQSNEGTMEAAAVDQLHDQIINLLQQQYQAEIR